MHEKFMQRCFSLARRAYRYTNKNPMVGAVLVHQERIIGEGYHEYFGGPHAEVNCFTSVHNNDKHLIPESELYISLEPCSHQGKTPPCANLIVRNNIKKVYISNLDINPIVRNNGVKILQNNGISVQIGMLEDQGKSLLHKFEINHLLERPIINLKWAQSKQAYAGFTDKSTWYTNNFSRIFAHRLRSENELMVIGANTILLDEPRLDNRLYPGQSPAILIIDVEGIIPLDHKVFDRKEKVYIWRPAIDDLSSFKVNICLIEKDPNIDNLDSLMHYMYVKHDVSSVLVEGGPTLHKLFVKANLWDYSYVASTAKDQNEGVKAATVVGELVESFELDNDRWNHIKNINN